MDIAVLGGLAVSAHGKSVTPTAPKPRQVLALLALHVDQVVSVEALIEELWGARPPRTARTTLQTYVLQLRELMGAALATADGPAREAKDVLVTSPGGYLLVGGDGSCDVRDFELLAGRGYRAADAEDYQGRPGCSGRRLTCGRVTRSQTCAPEPAWRWRSSDWTRAGCAPWTSGSRSICGSGATANCCRN